MAAHLVTTTKPYRKVGFCLLRKCRSTILLFQFKIELRIFLNPPDMVRDGSNVRFAANTLRIPFQLLINDVQVCLNDQIDSLLHTLLDSLELRLYQNTSLFPAEYPLRQQSNPNQGYVVGQYIMLSSYSRWGVHSNLSLQRLRSNHVGKEHRRPAHYNNRSPFVTESLRKWQPRLWRLCRAA